MDCKIDWTPLTVILYLFACLKYVKLLFVINLHTICQICLSLCHPFSASWSVLVSVSLYFTDYRVFDHILASF